MTDQLSDDDPLFQVARTLRAPVPIAPGIGVRVAARARRQRIRAITTVLAALLVAGTTMLTLRPAPGTSVTFSIIAPAGRSVTVVGDFTDWQSDRVELSPHAAGVWQATIRLKPGRYRYAFLVDHAVWRADNHEPSAPDDFGRPTSTLTVVKQ
jgi:1,4-alpha-glucan branching enzyme